MPYERKHPASRFPTRKLLTALVPPWVFLTSTAVNAQNALTPVNFPSKVMLCEPVNFTWTGGTPPYWLYIVGYESGGKAVGQNTTEIPTAWFVWIPDIPAIPESRLRIQIGGINATMRGGVFLSQLIGEDSSCLDAAPTDPSSTVSMTASSQLTLSPSTIDATVSSSSGLPTTSRSAAIPILSKNSLSKAAIAGIVVASGVVGIGLILVLFLAARWASSRRRNGIQQPGMNIKAQRLTLKSQN